MGTVKGKMASLLRSLQFARQGCQILRSDLALTRRVLQPGCFISTSKKNKDAITLDPERVAELLPKRPPFVADHPEGPNTAGGKADVDETSLESKLSEKNWISFGYEIVDRDADEWSHHMIMFATITVVLVLGGFLMAYMPDYRMKDWAQREAYLELHRREAAGLPLVNPDLVDPAKIELHLTRSWETQKSSSNLLLCHFIYKCVTLWDHTQPVLLM